MKKSLALILAAMMVAGTASVAFAEAKPADVELTSGVYKWDSDNSYFKEIGLNETIPYGSTVAFDLEDSANHASLTLAKEVRGVKAYPEYKAGSDLVESTAIEYKKVETTPANTNYKYSATTKIDYVYRLQATPSTASNPAPAKTEITVKMDAGKLSNALDISGITYEKKQTELGKIKTALASHGTLALKTADASITAPAWNELSETDQNAIIEDVFSYLYTGNSSVKEYKYVATMKLKKSTSAASKDLYGDMKVGTSSTSAKNNPAVRFNFTVEYDRNDTAETSYTVEGEENWVIDFDDEDTVDIEWTSDKGGTSYALFTVDVTGQDKLNVGFSTKFNSSIAAEYPDADLNFIKFTASPVFNRTGELYIYADEDSYIYEVTADGLKEIKNAKYDETYEAWFLKTRKLGSYVISDIELDLTASSSSDASSDASSSGTSSSNPVTGGTTGTTGGNTSAKPNPNTGR